jgi:hypothetical protein
VESRSFDLRHTDLQPTSCPVIDAYELVRRWNAKECYLVQYSGLLDFKESKNEWFKGPPAAMTTSELQRNIDSHLKVSGGNGRFRIKVANEGMLWTAKEDPHLREENNNPIGNVIEVEGLEKYTFKIENDSKEHKVRVTIEDTINRHTMQFDKPHKDKNSEFIIRGQGQQGVFSRGPVLKMELVHSESKDIPTALKILVDKGKILKGKKDVFHDDILISDYDASRLEKYFQENFVSDDEGKYLKSLPDGLSPSPRKEQIHAQQEAKSSKEKDKTFKAERVHVTESVIKQPIKFTSPKTIQTPVQPSTTEQKVREIKNANSASSSPIRTPVSQMTLETVKKVAEEDRKKSIKAYSTNLSPVRITSEPHISTQSVATMPTAIAHSSAMSSVSLSPSTTHTSDEHKEMVSRSSALDLDSTKIEVMVDDNILLSAGKENTAMIGTTTPIVSDKEIDKKPVLAEPIPTLRATKAKEEEEQIIVVSEKNSESNLLGITTPTLPSASNLISTNSDPDIQLTIPDEGRTKTENVNSLLDYFLFNPFLTGMDEFAAIGPRLSLNWFDFLSKPETFMPPMANYYKGKQLPSLFLQ